MELPSAVKLMLITLTI